MIFRPGYRANKPIIGMLASLLGDKRHPDFTVPCRPPRDTGSSPTARLGESPVKVQVPGTPPAAVLRRNKSPLFIRTGNGGLSEA